MKTSYTVFETIGNMDLRQLADDELAVIIKNLCEEQKNRKENAMRNDWTKLAQMISNYCEKYGSIQVREDIFIEATDDFSQVGEIW